MVSPFHRARPRLVFSTAIIFALATVGLLSNGAWKRWGDVWPAATPPSLRASGGLSSTALLGSASGIRQLAANVAWLRSSLAWERQEATEMLRRASRAVSAEPEEWYFWQQTARRLAFDLAYWSSTRDWTPWATELTDPSRREFFAQVALRWLDRAEQALPEDPAVNLERALIHRIVRGDLAEAARAYRDAWRKPGAPTSAARLYGEWLRESGDFKAALQWYREVLEALPEDEPAASRRLIEQRIERLLGRED